MAVPECRRCENASARDGLCWKCYASQVENERDRWREYCEGARESVATLTRERDAARNALAAVHAVVGSGS